MYNVSTTSYQADDKALFLIELTRHYFVPEQIYCVVSGSHADENPQTRHPSPECPAAHPTTGKDDPSPHLGYPVV